MPIIWDAKLMKALKCRTLDVWNTKRFKSRNLLAGGAKGVDFWAQKERDFWAQTERDFWAQKESILGAKKSISGRKRRRKKEISGR